MIWLLPAVMFSALDLFALKRENDRLRSFTRPTPALALFVWLSFVVMPAAATTTEARLDTSYAFWGLLFLLAVELLRQLPSPRELNAWTAHFLALLAFIGAFGGPVFPARYAIPNAILAVMVIGLGWWLFSLVQRRLTRGQKLVAALYLLLVSGLLIAATSTLVSGWGMIPSFTVIAGALLWYTGAIYDGWRRFIEPLTDVEYRLRLMFLAGQLCLAAGAGMQALGLFDFTL